MSTLYHFHVQIAKFVLAKRVLSQNRRNNNMYLQIIVTLRCNKCQCWNTILKMR